MAEPKKEDKKKKMGTAKLISIMVVIGLVSVAWGAVSRSKKNPRLETTSMREPQIATIVITTKYPGVPLHLNPDQDITAALVMGNIGWEKALNGIPARRFPHNGKPVDLVDPRTIGVVRTVAYRILENQGVDAAEIAYAKHSGPTPPSDWFDAALSNRQQ